VAQRIKRRAKVDGKRRPLKPWERNRLARNKAQVCRCDTMPFPHRQGSKSVVAIGRRSIEVRCQ
jgi:hypothetical protein